MLTHLLLNGHASSGHKRLATGNFDERFVGRLKSDVLCRHVVQVCLLFGRCDELVKAAVPGQTRSCVVLLTL